MTIFVDEEESKIIKYISNMNQAQYSRLFSFLFNIANDVLVQAFEKGDYKKITLPFIVCAASTSCWSLRKKRC